MKTSVTNETSVILDGEWSGPFADFCASNKFEDEEIAEIETALNQSGVFEGGGGALAGFTLRLGADEDLSPAVQKAMDQFDEALAKRRAAERAEARRDPRQTSLLP